MVPLSALWLPIVLSAVIIFRQFRHAHGAHLPSQQLPPASRRRQNLSTLRSANLQRGTYVFPFCTPKEMKSPATQEKYKQGPVGLLTIMPPGPPAMPKFLGLWFAYTVLVSFFVALPHRAHRRTWQFVSGSLSRSRHRGVPRLRTRRSPERNLEGQTASVTAKEVIDGLIYVANRRHIRMALAKRRRHVEEKLRR